MNSWIPGRALLKKHYFSALIATGADKRQLALLKQKNLVPILSLHRVTDIENNFWSPLKPQLFDQLLGYLTKNFELVKFSELQRPTKLPKAILSFDDGCLDFYEMAVPILKKYGLPANINIIPSVVLGESIPWHAELFDFLQFAPDKYVEKISLDSFSMKLNRSSRTQKAQYGEKISRFLKNRPRSERIELWGPIAKLIQDWKATKERPRLFMNLEEVRRIQNDHEIGAHSYTHESMAFESNDFFQKDFARCQQFFNDTLQQKLAIYAFPNGSYREEQLSYLLENQVETVLLVEEAFTQAKGAVHKRITLSADSFDNLKLQALGYLVR